MTAAEPRDLSAVHPTIERWFAAHLDAPIDGTDGLTVELTSLIGGGYSNEIIIAAVTHGSGSERRTESFVVRIPPSGAALFPTYDLALEVAVQGAVGAHGVAVPQPLVHEPDPSWLGTPFLVMPLVEGHCPGELPAVDPWIQSLTMAQQRAVLEGALDELGRIHSTPWQGQPIAGILRGATTTLADEVAWWRDLAAWVFDGDPPAVVLDAFAWCDAHRPTDEPPASLLWGDVRLGNILFADDLAPSAVLDWEMASIGPAELDLGWFTALDAMSAHFVDLRVPGFPTRDEIVARHESALGRPLMAFRWFEVFALCRSVVLSIRTDRLESIRRGKPPRSLDGNGLLAYVADAIDAYDPST